MREGYDALAARYGGALARIARATEADPRRCEELLQEMHVALWRSLDQFDGRCAERTWVYRVAHNVAASHVRTARRRVPLVSLSGLEPADEERLHETLERQQGLERARALVRELAPLDARVVLLWLEGLEAAEIGEVTGLSPAAVATRIHRAKALLSRRFREVRHE
jgi:RNA polymerase sigma-70 factor (ECF subfamily)